MRTMVLLGAGASKDAGLPLTAEFAGLLMDEMARDFGRSAKVSALNFVYAAMANHRGELGSDPRAAVNVETMISAIRLLAQRETHEAPPFITGWKPPVSAFGGRSSPNSIDSSNVARAVQQASIAQCPSGEALLSIVQTIAEQASGRIRNNDLYRDIERDLLVRVRRLLRDPNSVDYLSPLARLAREQPGGLDVATLNYDLTAEAAAVAADVPVNIGIDRWTPGSDLSFATRDGVLNLIKVHGSIDWRRVRADTAIPSPGMPFQRIERTDEFGEQDVPAIVIGDREKLASGGPILALLHAFQTALRRADRLVVVGYSFADAHVNTLIRDWINVGGHTVTVLDPVWPDPPPGVIDMSRDGEAFAGDFRLQLTWHLGVVDPGGGGRPPLMRLIRRSAADGLADALVAMPLIEPVPRFAVTSARDQCDVDVLEVDVTNLGSPLMHVSFSANGPGTRSQHAASELTVAADNRNREPWERSEARIEHMGHGETVQARLRFDRDMQEPQAVVSIAGRNELCSMFETWEGQVGNLDSPMVRRDPRLRG